jgi:hypothetical protein
VFIVWEGCESTYRLIIGDRGRDQSMFSVWEGHGSTYRLIVEDRGRDWSAFSMWQGHHCTYCLIIEDRGRDWSVFNVGEDTVALTPLKPLGYNTSNSCLFFMYPATSTAVPTPCPIFPPQHFNHLKMCSLTCTIGTIRVLAD